jgi:hypothetical protein
VDLLDVQRHLLELDATYNLEFVAFDPWQAEHLAATLEADSEHLRRNVRRKGWALPWCRAVPPTAQSLRAQATLVIESFADRRLSLYPCEPLRRDLLKVRVEEKSYGIRLTSPRDEHGHGDTFSAFALALLVAHETASEAPIYVGGPPPGPEGDGPLAAARERARETEAFIKLQEDEIARAEARLGSLADADELPPELVRLIELRSNIFQDPYEE